MSSFESQEPNSGVEVRRYAVKYTPPTIVIEYKKDTKLYVKKIKLKISTKSDAKRIVHKLIKQNSDLLHHDKICKEQVCTFHHQSPCNMKFMFTTDVNIMLCFS
jgi:hypothetical protein